MRESKRAAGPHSPDTCVKSVHWMFCMVLRLGAHQSLLGGPAATGSDLWRELGLADFKSPGMDSAERIPSFLSGNPEPSGPEHERYPGSALAAMQREWKLLRDEYPEPSFPDRLERNLTELCEIIGLDMLEREILGLAVLLRTDGLLEQVAGKLETTGRSIIFHRIGVLLNADSEAIRERLSLGGLLVRCGLLEPSECSFSWCSFLHMPQSELAAALRYSSGPAVSLFSDAFRRAPMPALCLSDYDHLAGDLRIAMAYMRYAIKQRKTGVNVLIYGPPGTGKSEFPRMLATELKATLYEIACNDKRGDPVDRKGRLGALRLAMTILDASDNLLMFDEVEDVFNFGFFGGIGKDFHKGWINRMLEENPLPCFWVTNDISELDQAFIRRFDLILEFNNPPPEKRERIIKSCGKGVLEDEFIQRMANHDRLTPAVIDRASRIADDIAGQAGAPDRQTIMSRLVGATLKAQRHPPIEANAGAFAGSGASNPTNADYDLDALILKLRVGHGALICFAGPPGTGKNASVRLVARQLNKPLVTRNVSEIMYVSVAETRNGVNGLFDCANKTDAVLVLEDNDNLLQDAGGGEPFSVLAINRQELRDRLASYRGILIVLTNRIGEGDAHSSDWFDLVIRFSFLNPEQVLESFAIAARELDVAPNLSKHQEMLSGMGALTPKDFEMVRRQALFKPIANSTELAEALLSRSRTKSTSRSGSIGFVR